MSAKWTVLSDLDDSPHGRMNSDIHQSLSRAAQNCHTPIGIRIAPFKIIR